MTEGNEQELDVNTEATEPDNPESIVGEDGVDATDWKALAHKNYGIAKRALTKLKKLSEVKPPEVKPEPDKSQDKKEFDLAEKSYLLANGIKKNEFQLVWDEVKATGKGIDDILESKYFQEKREFNASKEAIPTGTKRSSGAVKDEVDYWVQKGQFPPSDQIELRRKVAAALAKQAERRSKFSSNPII